MYAYFKKVYTIEYKYLSYKYLKMRLIIIIIIVLILYIVMQYNKLITLKNNRENAFADIDVQLKNRFDLVDNLVNTVKWYASHEKWLFENITKARTSFMDAWTVEDKIWANNMLTWALKSLFAVSEAYPDLKANQNFLQLQTELADLENKIASARRFFNNSTKEYNTYTEIFPTNIISNMFGFKKWEFFEIENEQEKKVPTVNFN